VTLAVIAGLRSRFGLRDLTAETEMTTWATIATLLQTCKMNAVDPTAWLTQTLERIANQWPSAEIDALMPWNYRA
jgi:hypothetical protein